MPGTRQFFSLCTFISLILAGALLAQTAAPDDVPDVAAAGYHVWQANRCAGCHTLYGQGGAYGPDLTHIYSQRGDTYLREFLVNPNAFHPGERIMPRFGLTISETSDLLAFLNWADTHEAGEGWPPRLIAVSGMGAIGAAPRQDLAESQAQPTESPAVARGRTLYSRAPAICSTCHSLEADVVIVGPSLHGIADRAWRRVLGQNAEEYIRRSILFPSEYIVPGYADVMQKNFGEVLTSDEINDLIAFLMTLEENLP